VPSQRSVSWEIQIYHREIEAEATTRSGDKFMTTNRGVYQISVLTS
jgi:hypothetical protein